MEAAFERTQTEVKAPSVIIITVSNAAVIIRNKTESYLRCRLKLYQFIQDVKNQLLGQIIRTINTFGKILICIY